MAQLRTNVPPTEDHHTLRWLRQPHDGIGGMVDDLIQPWDVWDGRP
jgi:hypothetical protein